jgi:hypothetical protein
MDVGEVVREAQRAYRENQPPPTSLLGHIFKPRWELFYFMLPAACIFVVASHCICYDCLGRFSRIAQGTSAEAELHTTTAILLRERVPRLIGWAYVLALRATSEREKARRLSEFLNRIDIAWEDVRRRYGAPALRRSQMNMLELVTEERRLLYIALETIRQDRLHRIRSHPVRIPAVWDDVT